MLFLLYALLTYLLLVLLLPSGNTVDSNLFFAGSNSTVYVDRPRLKDFFSTLTSSIKANLVGTLAPRSTSVKLFSTKGVATSVTIRQ